MNKKTLLVAIICLAVLACTFAAWRLYSPTKTVFVTPTANQAALAQLQADLQGVTPYFLDANRPNRQTYTSEEQKIKDDLVAFSLASNPGGDKDYYSGLWLDAIGTRYIRPLS